MFKLDFEKAEEPEIKLPTSRGSPKKEKNKNKNKTESSRKTSTFATVITGHGTTEQQTGSKLEKKYI